MEQVRNHRSDQSLLQASNSVSYIACQPCRKRKLRCDRGLPACGTCSRSDGSAACSYGESKKKPGVRAGYVEELEKRIEKVETMLLGQSLLLQKVLKIDQEPEDLYIRGILKRARSLSSPAPTEDGLPSQRGSPRRRGESPCQTRPPSPSRPTVSPAVQDDIVLLLLDIYFAKVHPWLSIIHESGFRERFVTTPINRPLHPLILSMMNISIRFATSPDILGVNRGRFRKAARQTIIIASTNNSSLETLQALIILALDIVGSGQGPQSWSIIGMMTRVVAQLGLNSEHDLNQTRKLSQQRYHILSPPTDPSSAEERRRTLWMVFFMDRISAVLTGWRPALSDDEISVRLPGKDSSWKQNEVCCTPLRSKSLASKDYTNYGSFAYLVDAMICLEKAQAFLQLDLDLTDQNVVNMTSDHSQALDFELSRWKMSLPRNVATMLDDNGDVDPTLVMVNATYTCSIILVSQLLAYQSPVFNQSISAQQRCVRAAMDATNQVKALAATDFSTFNPYYAYYVFVAARALLIHSVFTGSNNLNAVATNIDALKKMSVYWHLAKGFQMALEEGVQCAISGGNIDGRQLKRLLDSRTYAYIAVGGSNEEGDRNEMASAKRLKVTGDSNPQPPLSPLQSQGEPLNVQDNNLGVVDLVDGQTSAESFHDFGQHLPLDIQEMDFLGMRTDPVAGSYMQNSQGGLDESPWEYLVDAAEFLI